MKKGSKKVKKQPFAKHESNGAMGLIVALTVFNLVYSYGIGLPLPRAVVASYVESVHELGDAQVASYEMMGAAVVTAISAVQSAVLPQGVGDTQLASPVVYAEDYVEPEPPPLLLVSPNQISLATL